jgi:hypothetical protein
MSGDEFSTHDLSEVRDSATLATAIAKMEAGEDGSVTREANGSFRITRGSKGATAESLIGIKEVQRAMAKVDHIQADPNSVLSAEQVSSIKNTLKDSYSESIINQVIAQKNGKNSAFTVQTNKLKDAMHDIIGSVAENLKELTTLFDTEDADKILAYAKGAGFSDILDKRKAAEVRGQMREIAAVAKMTGKSAQEVVSERVQISNGLSSMYGGRVADKGLIDTVHHAIVNAERQGEFGLFSKEEAGAAAVRSIANVQNLYQGAISLDGVMAMLEESGGATPELKAKHAEFKKKWATASLDERVLLSEEADALARRYGGDELVDSASFRSYVNSKGYTTPYLKEHFSQIVDENIAVHLADSDLSETDQKALLELGKLDVSTFGSDRKRSADFHKLVASGDTSNAIKSLVDIGMDENQAQSYVSKLKATGVGKYNSHVGGTYLRGAAWLQQGTGSLADTDARKQLAVSSMLNSSSAYSSASGNDLISILSGELATGKLSASSMASFLFKQTNDAASGDLAKMEEMMKTAGVSSVSLGKWDGKQFSFVEGAEGDRQRANLKKALGIEDDAAFKALLKDPVALEMALESKGYQLAGLQGKDKTLYAFNSNEAAILAEKHVRNGGEGFARTFANVFGTDNTSLRNGENGLERVYRIDNKWKTEEDAKKYMKTSQGRKYLARMAADGNQDAIGLLSGSIKDLINESGTSHEAFKKLADKKDITVGDLIETAASVYGTERFTALGSGKMDILEEAGLVTKNSDGEYVYAKDFSAGNKKFTAGSEANAKAVEKATEGDNLYNQLKQFMTDGVLATGGGTPSFDQVERIIEYFIEINGKLDNIKRPT